jgi:acyl-CoA-binding protein
MLTSILSTSSRVFLFLLFLISTTTTKDIFWTFYWWARRSYPSSKFSKLTRPPGVRIRDGSKNEVPQAEKHDITKNAEAISPVNLPTVHADPICTDTPAPQPDFVNSPPVIPVRKYSTELLIDIGPTFTKAMEVMSDPTLESITTTMSGPDQLALYGLKMQATLGCCNTPQPDVIQFVERSQWNSWNQLGDMSMQEAKKHYLQQLLRLKKRWSHDETKKPLVDRLAFL